MKDVIIPIVFPDYKITVRTPRQEVDLLPWITFDNFTIPKTEQRLSYLGHAGILIINGKSGLTKYYEYGRYDYPEQKGIVRRVPLPDVKVNESGVVLSSLIPVMHKIRQVAGSGTRIEGVYIEALDSFDKLNQRAQAIKVRNSDPNRTPYNLTSNSCIHFVKRLVDLSGNETPWLIDPRPASYIGEFRYDYNDLDYLPKVRTLKIETMGEFN
ncbi:hypothetical protein [Vibrio campbellii]|uniref:Uncharacterized protein n=2 Tax=Vibrio campbellii TaxID=680 RepID=A0ACC7RGY1_9VIBR